MPDAAPSADPVVICPSCQAPMRRLALDGRYGTRLAIDLCEACQGFWFDGRQHLQIAPAAILQLFEIIHDATRPKAPLPARLPCPRCGLRMLATDDRQRATSFRYWRCAREHGRYITFVDFLREKDFVRELTAQQLAALKAQVRSVNCSNCGAPIDLTNDTVCAHCHTALAMLDVEQVGRIVSELRDEAERAAQPLPGGAAALGLALMRERQQVESAFREMGDPKWSLLGGSSGLVENGLTQVVSLLRRLSGS
jgi:TFIIB-like protein